MSQALRKPSGVIALGQEVSLWLHREDGGERSLRAGRTAISSRGESAKARSSGAGSRSLGSEELGTRSSRGRSREAAPGGF